MNLPQDWTPSGNTVFLFILSLMSAYNAWRARRIDATVSVVHSLVNSAMGVQKKSLAEVTAAKAAITHDETDYRAAESAMKDWLDHVARQSKADSVPPAGWIPPG